MSAIITPTIVSAILFVDIYYTHHIFFLTKIIMSNDQDYINTNLLNSDNTGVNIESGSPNEVLLFLFIIVKNISMVL